MNDKEIQFLILYNFSLTLKPQYESSLYYTDLKQFVTIKYLDEIV